MKNLNETSGASVDVMGLAFDQDRAQAIRARMLIGKARIAAEQDRIAKIKARGVWPKVCGPEGVDAPARGPLRVIGAGGVDGGRVAKTCDVFDLIAARAKRDVFTGEQVAIARHYGALIESHSKGATKCSSLEASGGGGSGGDFMDAYLQEGKDIDRLRAAVGDAVLQVGPRSKGASIKALDLVDRICVSQMGLKQMLVSCGWSTSGRNAAKLIEALSQAFDRMNGLKSGGTICGTRSREVDAAAKNIWELG